MSRATSFIPSLRKRHQTGEPRQEKDMALGSPFVWDLHTAWAGRSSTTTPDKLLNVAGSVLVSDPALGLVVETDGVVSVWSAVRRQTQVAYAPCKHATAVSWGTASCTLSTVTSSSDPPVEVIVSWLNEGVVVSPIVPPSPPAATQGMLLVRGIADETGDPLAYFKPDVELVTANGQKVTCPIFPALNKIACYYNDETGALTITRVSAGQYIVHVKNRPSGRIADDQQIGVQAGRPLVVPVRFRKTRIT